MPERELVGLIGLSALFLLLVVRAPVGLAMIAVGVGGNFVLSLVETHLRFLPYLKQFKTLLWGVTANYELSVVPLFVLMGYLSANGGLSRDLFQGVYALVGRLRGGAAIAAVGACAGFGAVCGSSLATSSTMGRIALPELRRAHYAPGFAAAVLAAGGTLGILIPPSVVLVIYSVVVEASIIRMFQAALLPGLIAVVLFSAVVALTAFLRPSMAGRTMPFGGGERRRALLRAAPVAVIFSLIILGLGLGLFTPTPAAAVGVFAVLAYGLVLRALGKSGPAPGKGGPGGKGEPVGLGAPELRDALLAMAKTTAMIYFILFGAEVLKGFFARSGLPTALAAWAGGAGVEPWLILILVLLIFIILGCFMESLSMILVMVPFFWPVLVNINGGDWVTADNAAFGMDVDELKIWFGILCLIVVELGLITPPVGLNIFIIATVARDIPMRDIFRGVTPFLGAEFLRVVLLLAFPALSLWLPALLSG